MGLRIPILDLSPQLRALESQIESAAREVLRSGRFILGPNVEAFERECAEFLGVRHAVGVNSGTDALVLALRALDIGPGDEVLAPAFTFFATAEVISLVGARPVFVDIRPDSFGLDPAELEQRIGPRTRAILPVHLFGHAVELDPVLAAAAEHGLAVIEDVAQAFGGGYRGRRLGSLGTTGAFSFFPSKNLGACGDGGLLVTNDARIANLARSMRNHGQRGRYDYERLGYNSRLDELQAAILRVKLPYVDRWNEERRRVAKEYHERLSGMAGVVIPSAASWAEHAHNQYTVRILGGRRDAVSQALEKAGIGTAIYYPKPLHLLPMYADPEIRLPATEQAAREVLSLPIWPELETKALDEISSALRSAL